MTRKCALCKGTNYKQKYSFFSAPKDPDIRKKWQAAIPIPNYTVTDETYVCSKHFRSTDIITHWVSGVPPHVVKIKYKKFRLRAGAVPCLDWIEDNVAREPVMADEVDRCDESLGNQLDFQIPREQPTQSIAVNSRVTNSSFHDSNESISPPIKVAKYVVIDQNNADFSQTEFSDNHRSYKTYVFNNKQTQDSVSSVESEGFDESGNHFDYQYHQIDKSDGDVAAMNETLREITDDRDDGTLQNATIDCDSYPNGASPSADVKLEQNVEVFNEELMINEDDSAILHTEHFTDNDDGNRDDMFERHDEILKGQVLGDNLLEALKCKTENKCSDENLDSGLCDTMLFEDLLEIYTEVTLPRGWAFLVTSKGHTTTVVYLYMNMPTDHIPVVEKEVYIKSDMVMHCGVGNKEINPFLHNLMKDGRNNRVHALSDIEELIDELDQRYICEGGPSVENSTDIASQLAYVDGTKWRHIGCPIIINNGSSKCSKCLGLNGIIARRRNGNKKGLSLDLLREKEEKIESLKKSLKKITRRNQRLEGIRLRFKHRLQILSADSEKTIKNRISSSNMSEIQKLMIKECLKASTFNNKNNVRYSETWIFLCLLLYVESPRMYRYMFINNYMALPSMDTIRKYFNQIKTDPQFYNLFQRSVEPYQPVNDQDEEEPS